MNIYFKYLLSLPKSLWFNFRHLPLKQALKLPFYVRYGTRVSVKGRIIIEDDNHVGMAMIVIGSHEADLSDPKHTTCLTGGKRRRIGISAHCTHRTGNEDIR